MPVPTQLFLIAGGLALAESLYSLRGGLQFSALMGRGRPARNGAAAPCVTLILPCRDVDPGLTENLQAYFEQDYPDFQVLLVTGDGKDPCVETLARVREQYPGRESRILFSGRSLERSQKVHNLLYALPYARKKDRVIAFGDSDIRPGPSWLRSLVEPLEDPEVGLSTGYRWYLPQSGRFSSVLRSVWNAGIVSLMNSRDCSFAWGGAMAVRLETFDRCNVREYWENALSDDYTISNAVHDHALKIRFQGGCLSFSHEDCTWRELLEWVGRQLTITRLCRPGLWGMVLISQVVSSLSFWGGLLFLSFVGIFGAGPSGSSFLGIAFLITAAYGLGCVKAWVRLRAVLGAFPEHERRLLRFRKAYVFWGPLASILSIVGCLSSLRSRRIRWRGILYEMVSCRETLVLGEERKGLGRAGEKGDRTPSSE